MLQVYAWGSGPCIGCGVETIALRPKVIDDFQNVCIVDISCGDSHCLALSNGMSENFLVLQLYIKIICYLYFIYLFTLCALTGIY